MGQQARMIEFSGVNKWFGPLHVLQDISLTVGKGEVVVVCGPSGSGKSTLIRCVNGLEPFEKGRLVVDGTGNNLSLGQAQADAALAGLDMGEAITIPALPDNADLDAYLAARAALRPNLSLKDAAPRYRVSA